MLLLAAFGTFRALELRVVIAVVYVLAGRVTCASAGSTSICDSLWGAEQGARQRLQLNLFPELAALRKASWVQADTLSGAMATAGS